MELVWNSRAVCGPLSRIGIVLKHERRAQHERKSNPEMSGIVISSFSDDLEGCSKSVPPASSTKTFSLIGFSWDPLGIPNHRIACPKRCRGSGGKRSVSSLPECWCLFFGTFARSEGFGLTVLAKRTAMSFGGGYG